MSDLADDILHAALQRIKSRQKPIGSTYRLQLHKDFTFRDASETIPYLAKLGITHLYASPYFKAMAGSTHGYDVVDHCRLNPELGTQADYDTMIESLKSHGMHHILDMVPNHVGIGNNDNVWWNDVLRNGPASTYAGFFDINWTGSQTADLKGRVLLPILGDLYAKELEAGKFKVIPDGERYVVTYGDRRFPLAPATYPLIQSSIKAINGTPGDVASFDAMDELLRRQHFRLAHWKTAPDEINYRRFFDINDLAGLAMERPEVFEATHKLVLNLLAEDKVAGLRIDHPDGLRDPKQYFERLQTSYVLAVAEQIAIERGIDFSTLKSDIANRIAVETKPLYVSVEKILALDEPLVESWPVSGTTGYEFLNYINGLFVDASAEEKLSTIYRDWIGSDASFKNLVYEKKKLILKISLASELNVLAKLLKEIAEQNRYGVDFSLRVLRDALMEVIASFPVYRSYITEQEITETDRKQIRTAIDAAKDRNATIAADVLDYIEQVLVSDTPHASLPQRRHFAAKFQQLTAPDTAKGIEDTTFYIYNRLLSLNEVGGDPSQFGIAPDRVHAFLADRQTHWPTAQSTLSTHDTKRSEDVRARLNVLSEIPEKWQSRLTAWQEMTAGVTKQGSPDANEQYAIFQTLLGAWPFDDDDLPTFEKRVKACVLKSMREAKVNTQWTAPNAEHESAVAGYINALFNDNGLQLFRDDLQRFQQRISSIGIVNSLAQTLLKFTTPGVPDTYQGTELWDLSLVDPDNRRPVDYAARQHAIQELQPIETLLKTPEDGRIKLAVTRAALAARKHHPELFERGSYLPLQTTGTFATNVFAFARQLNDQMVIIVIPRLVASMMGDDLKWPIGNLWQDTRVELPDTLQLSRARNILTGSACTSANVADLFTSAPLALIVLG